MIRRATVFLARGMVLSVCVLLGVLVGTAVRDVPAGASGGGAALAMNGDVDGDGAIRLADVICLLRYVFQVPGAPPPVACGDGTGLTPEQAEILGHFSIVQLDDGQGRTVKTIRISGVNVQIVNGEGQTETANGTGNLIVGYQELRPDTLPPPRDEDNRTGSHNVVVGGMQNYTSWGGLVAGLENTISGPYAAVSGGSINTANGDRASVSGGQENTASGVYSSVSGGRVNTASGIYSSVSGGAWNTATEDSASVSGGLDNTASGSVASVSGGEDNTADKFAASVSGGLGNAATGVHASVSGGRANIASGLYASVSGGAWNLATEDSASVSGGLDNTAGGNVASVSGGEENTASGFGASVSGGYENTATGDYASVSGGYQNEATAQYELKP